MNKNITLVIGGCRSGKSSFALNRADKIHDDQSGKVKEKYFLATSVPTDLEMEERVVKHKKERGSDWQTIEEPLQIEKIVREYGPKASVILVDCLTLWISNLLFQLKDSSRVEKAVKNLEKTLKEARCPVIFVSNEVGCSIVPENKLARQFRDLAGFVNQRIAGIAHTVVMTVAGIDVQIKPKV